MSRHRFVRNLDLDAEMADEDSEGESGMTAEEQAQMATSMPIARALVKDIQPPISDDAIADSLWHYWFDIDKTVGWLRKDWERKGRDIPSNLLPTPDQQRQRRSTKSARIKNTEHDDPFAPPLSALQRLSLARKERAGQSSTPPPPSLPAATPSASTHPLSTSAASTVDGKPMSKLALLAQKRREAAALVSATQSGSSSPAPLVAATPPTATPSPAPSKHPLEPAQPPSKLAQKMAAARAARAAAANQGPSAQALTPFLEPSIPTPTDDVDMESPKAEETFDLFSLAPRKKTQAQPSRFFDIVTASSNCRRVAPVVQLSGSLYIPYVKNEEEAERRVREAFGPGVESPDDIILKARGGRAGIGADTAADQGAPTVTKPKAERADIERQAKEQKDNGPTPLHPTYRQKANGRSTQSKAKLSPNAPESLLSTPALKEDSKPKPTSGKRHAQAKSSKPKPQASEPIPKTKPSPDTPALSSSTAAPTRPQAVPESSAPKPKSKPKPKPNPKAAPAKPKAQAARPPS